MHELVYITYHTTHALKFRLSSLYISRSDSRTMDTYRGTVVHCLTPERMEVLEDYVIGVDGGQVHSCYRLILASVLLTLWNYRLGLWSQVIAWKSWRSNTISKCRTLCLTGDIYWMYVFVYIMYPMTDVETMLILFYLQFLFTFTCCNHMHSL